MKLLPRTFTWLYPPLLAWVLTYGIHDPRAEAVVLGAGILAGAILGAAELCQPLFPFPKQGQGQNKPLDFTEQVIEVPPPPPEQEQERAIPAKPPKPMQRRLIPQMRF